MRRDVDDVIGDPQTAFNAASRRAGPESEERRTVMGTREGPVVVIEVKQQRVKGRLCTMFQPVPQPLVGSNLRALAPDTSFGAGRVLTLGRGIGQCVLEKERTREPPLATLRKRASVLGTFF